MKPLAQVRRRLHFSSSGSPSTGYGSSLRLRRSANAALHHEAWLEFLSESLSASLLRQTPAERGAVSLFALLPVFLREPLNSCEGYRGRLLATKSTWPTPNLLLQLSPLTAEPASPPGVPIGYNVSRPSPLLLDKKSALLQVTKHVNLAYHWIRDHVDRVLAAASHVPGHIHQASGLSAR